MPPLNARQRAFKNRKQCADGKLASEPIVENDWEDINDNETAIDLDDLRSFAESHNYQKTINNALVDNTLAGNRPKTYQGTSRTSVWRNKKELKAVDIKQKLISFGFVPVTVAPNAANPVLSRSQKEIINIHKMLDKLQEFIKPVMNLKSEDSKILAYNFVRYSSINLYFLKRLEGLNVGDASADAARCFWRHNYQPYRAKTIVKWAKEFLRDHKLSDHSQGKHSKRKCFLNDSDVKTMVLEEIRKTKPAERSLVVIKKYIEDVVVPSLLGVANRTVSETTISKYLYEWGYS